MTSTKLAAYCNWLTCGLQRWLKILCRQERFVPNLKLQNMSVHGETNILSNPGHVHLFALVHMHVRSCTLYQCISWIMGNATTSICSFDVDTPRAPFAQTHTHTHGAVGGGGGLQVGRCSQIGKSVPKYGDDLLTRCYAYIGTRVAKGGREGVVHLCMIARGEEEIVLGS